MTHDEAKHLTVLIEVYAQAAVDKSWEGSGPPEEATALAYELALAGISLQEYIEKLTEKTK